LGREITLAPPSPTPGGIGVCRKLKGPVFATPLLPGEAVAVRQRRVLSRKGRCVVRVRVFGDAALGWLDAAMSWGASVETMICGRGKIGHLANILYPSVPITPPADAARLPPRSVWDGILLATVASEKDVDTLLGIVDHSHPLCVVVAAHPSLPRGVFERLRRMRGTCYTVGHTRGVCQHSAVGGVTRSDWRLGYFMRSDNLTIDWSGMTTGIYP
jgi:hypothetical protein